jgi:hypothetical protein
LNTIVVVWDFDSGDTHELTPAQSNVEYDKIAAKKPNNILTLNHETHQGTVYVSPSVCLSVPKYTDTLDNNSFTVLPHALSVLSKKGYKFVTVADCLGGKQPYQSVVTPPKFNVSFPDSWTDPEH